MPRILNSLYSESPYDGFDPSAHPSDMQGWGSDDPILFQTIGTMRPRRIVEVGSWKGRSAINMAKEAKRVALDCEIVCVDTWLGSPEHWDPHMPDWYQSLRLTFGYPSLYYTFLANVVREDVADIITPFPSTSENAAHVLAKLGVQFEFAYIDAAHEYDSAKRDFAAFWDLLGEDGVLVGDDYLVFDGVTRAANDFARERGLQLFGYPGKFVLFKGMRVPHLWGWFPKFQ